MSDLSINLLQDKPVHQTAWDRVYNWVFKVGRYIIVFVELLVVVVFVIRLGVDKRSSILDQRIELQVKTLKTYKKIGKEQQVRNVQQALSGANTIFKNNPDFAFVIKKLYEVVGESAQIVDVSIQGEKVILSGISRSISSLNSIEQGFKNSPIFSDVQFSITSKSTGKEEFQEQGNNKIEFTVDARVKIPYVTTRGS